MVKYGMEIVALGTVLALMVTFTTISLINAKPRVLTAVQIQVGTEQCAFAILGST